MQCTGIQVCHFHAQHSVPGIEDEVVRFFCVYHSTYQHTCRLDIIVFLQEKVDALRVLGADVRPVPAVPFDNPDNYNHQVIRNCAILLTQECVIVFLSVLVPRLPISESSVVLYVCDL